MAMYSVVSRNPDGACHLDEADTFESAKIKADLAQSTSDARGNPFGYTYAVYVGIDTKVYQTHSRVMS